jgi:hypothetical protein
MVGFFTKCNERYVSLFRLYFPSLCIPPPSESECPTTSASWADIQISGKQKRDGTLPGHLIIPSEEWQSSQLRCGRNARPSEARARLGVGWVEFSILGYWASSIDHGLYGFVYFSFTPSLICPRPSRLDSSFLLVTLAWRLKLGRWVRSVPSPTSHYHKVKSSSISIQPFPCSLSTFIPRLLRSPRADSQKTPASPPPTPGQR